MKHLAKLMLIFGLVLCTLQTKPPAGAAKTTSKAVNTRVISFPSSGLGRIFVDQTDSTFMNQWPSKQEGIEARGQIRVPGSANVLLATCYADSNCLGRLGCLKAGDIQGLDVDGSVVNETYLHKIISLGDLGSLTLLGTTIGDSELGQVASHLRHLKELDIGYTSITDKGLANLVKLPSLATLRLRKIPIGETGTKTLAELKSLSYLDLSETKLTDSALTKLCRANGLSTLNLAKTNISDAGIAYLQTMPRLRNLDLSKTALTDDGLAALVSHLPNLEQLNLSDTKVTSRGILSLNKLKHLRKLWLRGLAKVDDSVVPVLSCLTNLVDIEIQGTSIRPDSVLQLSHLLPNAEIHSKTPCSCGKRTKVN